MYFALTDEQRALAETVRDYISDRFDLTAVRAVFVPAGHGRGFSLTELIIVLAIMGIIAAVAAPRYGYAIARYRVDTAARRIASDFNTVAALARASSSERAVTFKLSGNFYVITGLRDIATGASDTVVDMKAEPYKATIVSVDAGGDERLFYNGFGLPDSDAKIVVQVGGYIKTVIVDPATGRASVQ